MQVQSFSYQQKKGSLLPVKANTRDGPEHREHKRPGFKCLSSLWLRPKCSIRAERKRQTGGAKFHGRAGMSSPVLHLTGLTGLSLRQLRTCGWLHYIPRVPALKQPLRRASGLRASVSFSTLALAKPTQILSLAPCSV